jgi:hypothetical protein
MEGFKWGLGLMVSIHCGVYPDSDSSVPFALLRVLQNDRRGRIQGDKYPSALE